MNKQVPGSTSPMADLFESAFDAAHPDFVTSSKDHVDYRIPYDRLSGMWLDDQDPPSARGEIQWTDALKAAYRDGYSPLLWIGRGASAEVWRCVDRSFGREVAIKIPVLEPGKSVDSIVAALQEEAELLGRLHHPGIVHAVRRSGQGQSAYLALDFIDGDDLIEHCRLSSLDTTARLKLFVKVLEAVKYLHSKGIVHGDLKPEHLMVREDGQPVIIDFGLSSYDSSSDLRLDDLRRLGGSGIYRAPEIVSASAVAAEPQHDVYSLGVILRELLVADQTEHDEAIASVVRRATDIQAENRWADAGAMLQGLMHAISTPANQAIALTHESPQKVDQSILLSRSGAWLLAAVAVVAILGGILWAFPGPPEPNRSFTENRQNDRMQELSQRASLFEIAISNIYAGDHQQAQGHLQEIVKQEVQPSQTWEERHLGAMIAGHGEVYPFGEQAYEASHAMSVAFDSATQTIAYSRRGDDDSELWVKHQDGPPRLIANSVEAFRSVAISSGAQRMATIEANNRVKIYPLEDTAASRELPFTIDARVIWFSQDGRSLNVFSPQARKIEQWSVVGSLAHAPSDVIEACDHVYPLARGDGSFLVATAGEHRTSGLTQLRLIGPAGDVTRALDLEDGQLPASADMHLSEHSVVCLGMANGYVRIHDSANGGWQPHCDLGVNSPVPAVAYSATEGRVYAGISRVHVIDTQGNLITRLGDRNALRQLITGLHFDDNTATLTCVSIHNVWQSRAPRGSQ